MPDAWYVGADETAMGWQEEHRQLVATMPTDLTDAHTHSSGHRAEIASSATCGCFYCCEKFRPDAIREWLDDDEQRVGRTALCPSCGIDSVLGDKAGFDLSEDLLHRMQACWF